ncbi:ABC transporter ATP-binding protein [Magnetospirillum gryphiswaldense]|uniref:High-affinity branched-chain amino acid transport, ATP-binding protein n=1 Tax=Magnetospirillum gryphiswaldense TaxID=55518 RepID=A4TZB0_9PROT|nr:ABC transporter ATP-binding protein [Magnetospirillum gryphiswaldense]AVM74654.1 Lipopolysaccharide export system ATP-binding protein LptB [Magnetospirillum gryphiswaldense MSR-1]AVM78557.1 Lipopolysaccharide export system ATP-binding protein LptB [Magnetospirillum gryphiswaldense]CAM75967.1 high-affinity branched-chain amino acid transport, ATP-binding protein [Magnetospirillum gryphiswaldense MSR-1]
MSLLAVDGLSKEFGGVHAVQDLSFSVAAGTIHSIIGPNGAGKTTLFNLITGIYTPSAGRITLDGTDIAGKSPSQLARLGMSRTFQNLQIFFNMSAVENVMVGAHLHVDRRFWPSLLRLPSMVRGDRACRQECLRLLDFVGLAQYAEAEASAMPYGGLKRLEIARALAAKPKLLLLDEPAAGLNATESREIDEVIKKVAGQGITVVLVEHDMKMVMGISDHILALDYGRKLAEGTPAQVRANADVIAAYLGAHA